METGDGEGWNPVEEHVLGRSLGNCFFFSSAAFLKSPPPLPSQAVGDPCHLELKTSITQPTKLRTQSATRHSSSHINHHLALCDLEI